jgi:glycosyltransferase involved in cell wall biosynthesis
MSKPLCVISCPIDTYSGYGARSRDLVKAIIELKKEDWDIKILSQRWGDCSWGFINDNPEWAFLNEHLAEIDPNKQPEVWMQITIPSEFQPIGKYNIGVTAGIESTVCHHSWIEGLNRMNTNWVSSNHAKMVFETTTFEQKDQFGNTIGILKANKPIEVVLEGANLNIYKYLPEEQNKLDLSYIKEDFSFLFVGHWMQGDLGEDRKNVGLLIKGFFETFKNRVSKPALILKVTGGVSSYSDRDNILAKISAIKQTCTSDDLPNIYLLHGDFTDEEMNELYNHPKVKSMVCLTKGEGFGRPLLEFSLIRKPIIASNWSGQTDFLMKAFHPLLGGELKPIHPSAVNQFLLAEGSWFNANLIEIGTTMLDVFMNYHKYLSGAKQQSYINKEKFSFDAMKGIIKGQFVKVPTFALQMPIQLPNLTKKLTLPNLSKKFSI